jgi:type 1 glutamine amidotransferase
MEQQNAIRKHQGRAARTGWALALALALIGAPCFAQVKPKVLDFWGVGGFAHGSRIAANTLLDSLSKAMGFDLVQSDQPSVMTPANLAQYQVVILNNSTESGKIFSTDQRAALLDYIKKGGFIGFHGSGDTKGSWPDYTTYLGGELSSHGGGIAKLNLDTSEYAKSSVLMKDMPVTQSFDEEWYAYKTNPRLSPGVHVLYTLDEASCAGCTKMGGDHPIMWVKEEPTGGRTFYYAMGHGDNIFKTNAFCKTMLARALSWTSDCTIKSPVCNVGIHETAPSAGPSLEGMSVTGGSRSLTVETPRGGRHRVELLSLNGKRIAQFSGSGAQSYVFGNLRSGAVYSVVLHARTGRQASLVAVP